MDVTFYRFSKRKNSTQRPSGAGYTVNCLLKDDCTVSEPLLELQPLADIELYNYAYIKDWGRYYYINEWHFDRGLNTCRLKVDVLASWVSQIKASSAQVLFSSSHYNLDVMDNRIAAEGTVARNIETAPFVGIDTQAASYPHGYFFLTCLDGSGTDATGVATTYVLNYTQIQLLAADLLNPTTWEAVKQYWNNPMDAIIDCYYLPIDATQYLSLSNERALQIGNYTFPHARGRVASNTNLSQKWQHTTIDIPYQYGDFRDLAPYSSVEIFVPFCGSKPIPTDAVYGLGQILLDYSIDITTGDIQCIAYLKETVIQEWSGNCRITLPIGQTQTMVQQTLGAAAGAVTGFAGLASGNVAMGASGFISALGSVISPEQQKMLGGFSGTILGVTLGNNTGRWQEFRCTVTYHETNTSPAAIRAVMGNLNGSVLPLANLTGYVQTIGASVSAPAYGEEIAQINQLLDGGVYFE